MLRLIGQRLQNQLGHAFAGTHHIGRAHGLVGGYQNKVFNPTAHSRPRHVERAKNIVVHADGRIGFDDGHVLVGGSVVDRVGAVALANPVQSLGMIHGGQ